MVDSTISALSHIHKAAPRGVLLLLLQARFHAVAVQ